MNGVRSDGARPLAVRTAPRVAVRTARGATHRSARAMPPLRSLCAPALAALLLPFAADASGTCQRLVPGTQMDGNGCGPADSAVGDACNTADDCFFGQTPGRCVCTPAGPPPAGPPPPPVACVPPPPPPPRKIPLPCTDFFDINRHCPSHGLGHVVPASCDEVASCRGVFVSWYERCWFDRDLQMALDGAPGSRDELTGFYQACNTGGGGSGGPPPPSPPPAAAGDDGGKPPPPPPPLSPDTCLDLSARAAELNVECCDEASEDCSSGQPVVCNVGCSAVVLPFFADCSGALGAAAAAYTDLVEMCHHPTVNAHVISSFCTQIDPLFHQNLFFPFGCNVNLTDNVIYSAEYSVYTGPTPAAPATGARSLCVCALLARWRLHEPERRFHVRLCQRFHWRSLRDGCASATAAPRAHVRLEPSTRWWASLKSSTKLPEWPMHLWVLWQPLLWVLMISI
jgi:hypothetical protein